MSARLHALTPLGTDDHGDVIYHQPMLLGADQSDDIRCEECGNDAGRPHAELCPIGKLANGKPRYPGWLLYRSCGGMVCCWSPACERQHMVRHTAARLAASAKVATTKRGRKAA